MNTHLHTHLKTHSLTLMAAPPPQQHTKILSCWKEYCKSFELENLKMKWKCVICRWLEGNCKLRAGRRAALPYFNWSNSLPQFIICCAFLYTDRNRGIQVFPCNQPSWTDCGWVSTMFLHKMTQLWVGSGTYTVWLPDQLQSVAS